MRTTCPSCDTAYTIPDDRIGPKGRKVRCTRCSEQWTVSLADLDPTVAFRDAIAADDAAPEAPSTPAAPVSAAIAPAPSAAPTLEALPAEPITTARIGGDADEHDATVDTPPTPAVAVAIPNSVESVAEPPPLRRKIKPAAKRSERTGPRWKRPRLPVALTRLVPFAGPTIFACACLAFAGLGLFRASVVSRFPGLAGFYRLVGLDVNLRGLDFGPIETLREIDNGQPVLVVEGSLANTTGATREVPALRFALRDDDQQELYAWSVDPRATTIAAGDRMRFRTRLVAPPDRAADLQVRFAERRNRQAGLP